MGLDIGQYVHDDEWIVACILRETNIYEEKLLSFKLYAYLGN